MGSDRTVIWFAVAAGGAVGALSRYAAAVAIGVRQFPWATLAINVSGCFLLAFLVAGPLANVKSSPLALGLTVGVLGGYTTFSTFGLETIELIKAGRGSAAFLYVATSTIAGVASSGLGYWLGQRL